MPRRRTDSTGQTYGRLTVVEDAEGGKNPKVVCRCKCGTVVTVLKHNVRRGNTTSCGCARSERMHKVMKSMRAAAPKKVATAKEDPSMDDLLDDLDDPSCGNESWRW